jgi:hypothetical protein
MTEHEQREPTEPEGEQTIRDLEVPDDDAGRVSGGISTVSMNYSKFETYEPPSKK